MINTKQGTFGRFEEKDFNTLVMLWLHNKGLRELEGRPVDATLIAGLFILAEHIAFKHEVLKPPSPDGGSDGSNTKMA